MICSKCLNIMKLNKFHIQRTNSLNLYTALPTKGEGTTPEEVAEALEESCDKEFNFIVEALCETCKEVRFLSHWDGNLIKLKKRLTSK